MAKKLKTKKKAKGSKKRKTAKKRYALVGVGHRGVGFFIRQLLKRYGRRVEIVGYYDSNIERARRSNDWLGTDIPVFRSFKKMLDESKPHVLIVATKDSTHQTYIVPALERGLEVITEKPMATDAAKCRVILEAERKAKKPLRVAFNYRYTPYAARFKKVLMSGVIGPIQSVELAWFLNTSHGADYFRRWHRRKENSGGLFVHKATHHFDIINWCLEQDPVEVYARGSLVRYGPKRKQRGKRCLTCKHTKTCEFYLDVTKKEEWRHIYLGAEHVDGYHRDGCVFDPEINIEDDMAAVVTYSGGAKLSYTLRAYCPFEGYRIAFQGLKGRMEVGMYEGRSKDTQVINIYPGLGKLKRIIVPRVKREHGGGDELMLKAIMNPSLPDPLKQRATARQGALSILTGIAANESMKRGRPVRIASLIPARLLKK